jgi:hypothetical protein
LAFLIRQDERAGRGIIRVLREQNERILTLLTHWEASPADAIHRARQSCKRARAAAHLLKPAAPYVAAVEAGFFRDIQKRVAYARDAEALVEALDYLAIGVTEARLAESVAMLRDSLAGRAAQNLDANRLSLGAQIQLACEQLRVADRRLADLPLAKLRRRDLRQGAERTWSHCVADYGVLHTDLPASAFHAWRRRVKYAALQTQLLGTMSPIRAMTIGPRLRELAALLGRMQDLHLLEELLRQQPDALRIDTHVQRLRQLSAASLDQMRRRAVEFGGELFGADAGAAGFPGIQSVT